MWKFYRYFCRCEEYICGFLFFSIVVLVFASAALRLINQPLIWADDIAKLFFAWAAFLGADVAMRYCRLVGVDILVNTFPPKVLKATQIFGNLIIAVILVTFVLYGIKLSEASWERYFQTIPVSYSLVTLSLPVGAFFMLITTLVKLGRLLWNFSNDGYSLAAVGAAEYQGGGTGGHPSMAADKGE